MEAVPPFDHVLNQALRAVDNQDVQIFYAYVAELKQHVRRHLRGNARTHPGDSAVVQSALLSFLCDLVIQDIPLSDVDEYGYPMLWPMLLGYLERHCDKWNKYYQAKKRRGMEVSLGTATGADRARPGLDPADHRADGWDEAQLARHCAELDARLTEEERDVFGLWLAGKSLEETSRDMRERGWKCGLAKVSDLRKRIRRKLMDL